MKDDNDTEINNIWVNSNISYIMTNYAAYWRDLCAPDNFLFSVQISYLCTQIYNLTFC